MRRFRLIDWGALAAAAVGSLGCMGGGNSPFASKTPGSTAPTFAEQSASPGGQGAATFAQSATAGASGISQAFLNNPVSRAVKGAFGGDSGTVAQVQTPTTTVSPTDPLALSNPGKPPSPELYTSMGLMAERAGNLEKARQFYEQAVTTAPADAEALLAYGHFHDRQGRLDQATKLYLDAIHADPQHAGAHNDLGLCYARQGQLPQALELVRRAAELRPDRPIYRNNAAKVLVEMRRNQDAVNELAAVLTPAEAQYNVGCFLAQSGRQQEAANHFAAAVQIDPNMENARAWLARLQPGTMAALGAGDPRMSSRYAPGATTPAQFGSTPLGQGGASSTAPEYTRMPLITNVRPASGDDRDTAYSSLPQASTGSLPQQQVSYAESSPFPPASGGTLPDQSYTWGQEAGRYSDPSANPYQVPNPAATPGLPGTPGNASSATSQPTGRPYFNGDSHSTPWGDVPSPYHGSSYVTPLRHLATAASTATPTTAAPQRSEPTTPTTYTNPYATTPWGQQQRIVRQPGGPTMW